MNPLVAGPDGVVAVDARTRMKSEKCRGHSKERGEEQEVQSAGRSSLGGWRGRGSQGGQGADGPEAQARIPIRPGMARRAGLRSIVLGVDGSPHSRRAAAFLARLAPPTVGRVTVMSVVEPTRPPSIAQYRFRPFASNTASGFPHAHSSFRDPSAAAIPDLPGKTQEPRATAHAVGSGLWVLELGVRALDLVGSDRWPLHR